MSALTLGLIAACAWAIHDICVRYVSQNTPLMASLMTVLVAGLGFHLALMAVQDGFVAMPGEAMVYAVVAGVFFLFASLGLYGAFQRGPVKLVAPIIASYPVLSVGWAAISGTPVSAAQWAAVLAIALGVSLVAALAGEDGEAVPSKGRTVALAALSAVGFAGTFAFGQHAAELSHDLPATLVTRVVTIVLLLGGILALRLPLWPGRRALPVLGVMGVMDGIALACVLSAGGMADAQYASVTSSMFGLLTILLAWVVLRERMTAAQWAGCLIAFGGVGYLAL